MADGRTDASTDGRTDEGTDSPSPRRRLTPTRLPPEMPRHTLGENASKKRRKKLVTTEWMPERKNPGGLVTENDEKKNWIGVFALSTRFERNDGTFSSRLCAFQDDDDDGESCRNNNSSDNSSSRSSHDSSDEQVASCARYESERRGLGALLRPIHCGPE